MLLIHTGRNRSVYSWVFWHSWHTWPPPPITHPLRCSLLAMPWITSCLFHMRKAYPETYCEPCPLNHAPLLVEMLAAGRLPLLLQGCCHTAARLLLNCCYRLQLDFMLCDHFLLRVFYVYAWEYVCLSISHLSSSFFRVVLWSFRGSFQTPPISAH